MVAVSSTLPVRSTTATLTPVRRPGSSPIVARGPAGAASSRSCRLRAKTRMASSSALSRSSQQLAFELPGKLHLPRPASGLQQPCIGRPSAVCDIEARGDPALAGIERLGRRARLRSRLELIAELQGELQDLLLAAAEERQRAMRRNGPERLLIVEVIAELRAGQIGR